MPEKIPSPELELQVRQALRAPDPDPAFVARLDDRLRACAPATRRAPRRTGWAWAVIVVAVLLAAALLVGPSDIVAALQRLLGYIPGIGMVDDAGGLRLLAEPVSQVREGITLTVEQAVLDSQHTVVVFRADGIPHSAYPEREDEPFCADQPSLRLPDGALLTPGAGGGRGWGSGFESRREFPAIPAGVDRAVFSLPCLMDTAPGAAPEDWELALRFVAAPPDLTVAPVLQVTPPPAAPPATQTQTQTEMGLVLEQVIELEDAYILMGVFQQGDALPGATVWGMSGWPEITNGAGQSWPFEIPDDLYQPVREPGQSAWAFRVPKGFDPPLTITVTAVDASFPAQLTFSFDAGPDPQPEQQWVLNDELEIAGYSVRLVSIIRHTQARTNGYEFFFEADPGVTSVVIEDRDHAPVGGYGGGSPGEFSVGIVYEGSVPSGRLTYHITGLSAQIPGQWRLSWSPPEGSQQGSTALQPQACLTPDAWRQALANPAPIPEGLAGHLIAYGRIVQDGLRLSPENAGVFVIDLTDGRRQILGPGTWPSLSRDGTQAAYSGFDGLRLVDLASGENRLVPGTTSNDYDPRFSPDGSQLAFRRIDDLNLYVVQLDGSGLRRITADPEYDLLIDWSADGLRLFYAALAAEGLSIRSVDLIGGQPTQLFLIDAKDISAALSPDGAQIAYMARLPESMESGLFLANLDGSQARLLAQTGAQAITNPVWSPDGRWLLVNVAGPDPMAPQTTAALIELASCQAIPLLGLDGTVQGWSR